LLIAGGSDPMGSEIDGTQDSEYNRAHSFAGRLTDPGRIFADYEAVNICAGGISNSFILRNTLLWFDKYYDPDFTEVYVIVGWADSARWEIPSMLSSDVYGNNPHAQWLAEENNDYLSVNLGWIHPDRPDFPDQEHNQKIYHEFITNFTEQMELNSLNFALQLQWFLKSKNVPYLMIDTLHNVKLEDSIFNTPYANMIDQKRYINFGKPQDAFYYKYEKLGYTNPKAQYYHHGEDAHLHYSHTLEDHILKHNLL